MKVIGIVGLPGSGKSEAAAVAEEMGIPVVTMGDVIRRECRDRGLDPADHHGEIAQKLREENGLDAIAQRSLPVIEEALEENDTVLVDGIRAGVEVQRFEEAFGDAFTLVSVEAPFELRAERVESRGRDNTDDESLRERDERERGFGMDDAIARAEVTVENTASLESFQEKIRALVEDGVAGLERARTSESGPTPEGEV
ncbi:MULTISPECIES: AAA family ATPase [Halorussus]|uniref:AAA family ATPase n=1 Tax=Halorussus TaxID=1070314 RepID=UPI00209FEC4C|nr:AAA family ATPase [Halorussus vallis]USZ74001.1 AAA family ATPase [Halorussus vallis]